MVTRKADKWLLAATIAIVIGGAFVYAQEQKTKDVSLCFQATDSRR
jgi:hypothetical protein